jgi:lipopolysaccharide/colanic/teichoic acid biosynthesis glycosyltransferase
LKHVDFSESVNVVSDARALRDAAHRDGSAILYRKFGKRVLDLALVVLLAAPLAIVIGILLLIVRRDGGPGLFGHTRIGQDGTTFRCWKIRTMVIDSEARLEQHLRDNPEAAAEWARDHKLTNDPRITRIGRFLRRTSLDELPQIWNVAKGEMTFVGPRPIVYDEMVRYGAYQAAYLAMKPGVTGLWQVNGRNYVTYDERVQMDVDYFERMSFWLDLSLIARTVLTVVKRTGK